MVKISFSEITALGRSIIENINNLIPSEKSVPGTAAAMIAIMTMAIIVTVVQEPTAG